MFFPISLLLSHRLFISIILSIYLSHSSGTALYIKIHLAWLFISSILIWNYHLSDFDFHVPGVSSMSLDTHKYGYALKGTSVCLYANKELRQAQYFCYADWTGGLYTTPTLAGSFIKYILTSSVSQVWLSKVSLLLYSSESAWHLIKSALTLSFFFTIPLLHSLSIPLYHSFCLFLSLLFSYSLLVSLLHSIAYTWILFRFDSIRHRQQIRWTHCSVLGISGFCGWGGFHETHQGNYGDHPLHCQGRWGHSWFEASRKLRGYDRMLYGWCTTW